MPGKLPVPREITADHEREAWERRQEGWTLQRIADHIGVDVSTVCRQLQRVEKRLAAEFKEQAEEIKARQTAQLELIYRKSVAAWERSCEDGESVSTTEGRFRFDKESGQAVALPDEVKRTRTGQSGNPALLAQAVKALSDIRAIWGLDAPKKTAVEATGEAQKFYVCFNPEEHL